MNKPQEKMEQSELSQLDTVTATKSFDSSSSFQADNKETLWKRAKAFFRSISLVEYRTPLYFAR